MASESEIRRATPGGISTTVGTPAIFIATGQTGTPHGYEDKFPRDGSFRYTGQGPGGDKRMQSAIRDHASNGNGLLVLRATGKSRPYTFVDGFSCAGWEYVAAGYSRRHAARGRVHPGADQRWTCSRCTSCGWLELVEPHWVA